MRLTNFNSLPRVLGTGVKKQRETTYKRQIGDDNATSLVAGHALSNLTSKVDEAIVVNEMKD
jgi:hypothetical protein